MHLDTYDLEEHNTVPKRNAADEEQRANKRQKPTAEDASLLEEPVLSALTHALDSLDKEHPP